MLFPFVLIILIIIAMFVLSQFQAQFANSSGWQNAESFIKWMKHFINHSNCYKKSKVLLLLDNHDSHVSVELLNLAKENGVEILSFPPHCSHKLQPLDRTVYGPLKRYYNTACDQWMTNHPGKPMTIYDISGNVGIAYPLAFTPKNIQAGFAVAGIVPFNRLVFSEDELASSTVTDRANPNELEGSMNTSLHESTDSTNDPRTSSHNIPSTSSTVMIAGLTPEQVMPFPKAGPRKMVASKRKKATTRILTDTPVKDAIENEALDRANKKRLKPKRLQKSCNREDKPKEDETSSDSSEDDERARRVIIANIRKRNIFEDDSFEDEISSERESETEERSLNINELKPNDFVIVEFKGKKSMKHYVGEILGKSDGEFQVKYLRRKEMKDGEFRFFYPEKEDVAIVSSDDIKDKLPIPFRHGGTMSVPAAQLFKRIFCFA